MSRLALAPIALALVATAAMAAAPPAQRIDPYKSYKFRLTMEGRPVAAFQSARHTTASPDVVKHRAGGDPSTPIKSPGRTKWEAITLKRGVTQDPSFRDWAAGVGGAPGSRRDLELAGGAGGQSLSRCRVADSSKLPTLGADGNAIAIEHIHLQCEQVTPHR
jgi:phage tail-like protein